MKLYADITKTEEADDGTIKVFGYASSGAVDADGEIITADAMKAALPDYLKWGAVREMHQSKAAGTAIEARVEDDGRTYFAAHVVDAEAVKKVKAGVYKGFSIGGKVTARDALNKSTITGLKLVEVSLVDRPANPEAVMTCFKAEGVEGAAGGDIVAKGMYAISDFAGVLRSISYLAKEAEDEAQWEGDASPVPAQLREWLKQGADIFHAMAKEEVGEMLAQMQPAAAKAQAAEDLHKAGAKFSSTTKAALKAAHDACKAADKALADLGYDAAEGEADAAAAEDGADANKAESPSAHPKADDPLNKALSATRADLSHAQQALGEALQKAEQQAQRIAQLEAEPTAAKGVLKAIGKGQDAGAQSDALSGFVPITHADGSLNAAATLIKAAQARVI